MILVRTIMNALPEKQKELMLTLLSMIDTAEKEKGCLSYDVYCGIDGKTAFNLIEEWESREALDRHIRSDGFSVLLGTKSLLAKPMEMRIHTFSHSEGFEIINALRGKGIPKKNF